MKLLHITFHFEFTDSIETLLERNGVCSFVCYPMMQGKDIGDEKHYNTQVYPGALSVIHAQINDDAVETVLAELQKFRDARKAHQHLEAVVLPVERHL